MTRLIALVVLIVIAPFFAIAETAHPPNPFTDHPTCLEGQRAITTFSGQRSICYWPADEPRFGCPDDWVLTTRGGAFESCRPKGEQPVRDRMPRLAPQDICAEGEVVYHRVDGPRCAPIHADAGQSCTSGFDCTGHCLATTDGRGECAAGPLGFGCTEFLTGPTGEPMTICID